MKNQNLSKYFKIKVFGKYLKKNRSKVKWVHILGTRLQFTFNGSEGDFTVI